MSVTMQATPGGIALSFPYDPGLVSALKASVPSAARRWDNGRKLWLIETAYGKPVADLVYTMTGERVAVPQTPSLLGQVAPEIRLLQVEYVGRCKQVGAGLQEPRASGYANGDWSVTFPESVLRDWFEGGMGNPTTSIPRRRSSHYTTLGIPDNADDDAIKGGYRRMAKLTHPDVDREPGAADRFRAVQMAYSVLSDPLKRRKYNAGLALQEASEKALDGRSGPTRHDDDMYGYRSPLRCGWVLCEGLPTLGRFAVSKILTWQPITNDKGEELVTSWAADAKTFSKIWVKV